MMIFLRFEGVKRKDFNMHWARGLLLMALIGGSWLMVVTAQKPGLLRYFMWDEFVLRLFTGHHQRHSQWYSFLYIYFPVLILGSLPWSYFAGLGLRRSFRHIRPGLKKKRDDNERKSLFLALWFAVPLTIFIMARSKLPLYVLPLFVPLAIMTAMVTEENHFPFSRFRTNILVWCILLVFVRPVMGALDFRRDASKFVGEIQKRYPYAIGECVFVNVRPALGLQFYTGADVKYVALERSEIRGKFQGRGARLWFVPPQDADQFYDMTGRMNMPMHKLGLVRERDDYVLFREIFT
jgi:4-amino-4-deoxy-L-arabinose transferase-like glycosyltransferase